MLESAAVNNNSSQSVNNPPSSRQRQPSALATSVTAASSSSSHLEAGGGSKSTLTTSTPSSSSTTTPTSSAAPPSMSAAALDSAARPRHDVPDYISRQSYHNNNNKDNDPASTSSRSSTAIQFPSFSSSSTNPVISASHRQTSSMNPSSSSTTSVAFSHGPPASQPSQHLRQASSQQQQQGSYSSPASSRLRPTVQASGPVGGSEPSSPSRIKVRDLSHVQSFASAEFSAQAEGRSQDPGQRPQERQYEISSMPTTDVIEMVAGLLTKITATNDVHHNDMRIPPPDGTANLSPQATSVLAFHGKNVPAISILSYLTRINKYCPTTYEVFISLLVYFDRMTDLVNRGHLDRVRHRWGGYSIADVAEPADKNNDQQKTPSESGTKTTRTSSHTSPIVTPPSSTGMTAQDPASPSISPSLHPQSEGEAFSHSFVVDSYNIHRLVIAGVTCASKFFSDVFYTNSRYAKVFV